jgi:hypothetical protein
VSSFIVRVMILCNTGCEEFDRAACGAPVAELRVDGGACVNDLLMQARPTCSASRSYAPRSPRRPRSARPKLMARAACPG